MRKRGFVFISMAFVAVLCLAAANVSAKEIPVVTGEHWVKSTNQEKKAFLLGMGTIISLEFQVQGPEPCADKTLVDTWVKGLKGYDLETLVKDLDGYYANHKDKLARPVVEVLWTEFTLPNAYPKK